MTEEKLKKAQDLWDTILNLNERIINMKNSDKTFTEITGDSGSRIYTEMNDDINKIIVDELIKRKEVDLKNLQAKFESL